ncbi:aminotransferase class IV [Adhaeribacter aquaticus]|uniref:aminotransferase class IV n=1 Tax=Adhaeribacter aquaticus TaxID=299567 RepID=UPI000421BB1A|nr:aminotransferase class IV [Adhaeribacter aquaticus]
MFLLHNLELIQEEDFSLSYLNRSFQYNDGFFDTLIWKKGRIEFLTDHLKRSELAHEALGLKLSNVLADPAFFEAQVNLLIDKNNLVAEVVRVKIQFWRKAGGLFTPESDAVENLVSVQPQQPVPVTIARADFYNGLPNRFTPFSFFKGPYALHYVQASIAKKKAGLDELILVDEKGHISECLVSNIFWIINGTLYTPDLKTGCIAGIMRLNILKACEERNIPVHVGFYDQPDLMSAEAVFTSNVTGLRVITQIGKKQFHVQHKLVQQLQSMFVS